MYFSLSLYIVLVVNILHLHLICTLVSPPPSRLFLFDVVQECSLMRASDAIIPSSVVELAVRLPLESGLRWRGVLELAISCRW